MRSGGSEDTKICLYEITQGIATIEESFYTSLTFSEFTLTHRNLPLILNIVEISKFMFERIAAFSPKCECSIIRSQLNVYPSVTKRDYCVNIIGKS